MHPDDGKKLGLSDGQTVSIGNELGEIRLAVEIFSGLQSGTVVCESLWPNCEFADVDTDDSQAGAASTQPVLGINVLTSAEPGKPNGGAVFHDTAVWIRADLA